MDEDDLLDEVAELDQDPILGLGELPDYDDAAIASQAAEPAEKGAK